MSLVETIKLQTLEFYTLAHNKLDVFVSPYNLPISTESLLLALIAFVVILLISLLFGGSSSSSRSRTSVGQSSASTSTFSKKRGNQILLLGLPDTGKTTLFLNLVEKSVSTYASISPNKGHFNNGRKKIPILDIPGHSKIRPTLPQYLSQAISIVYMIDSSTFIDHSTEEAQNLFDILVDSNVYERKIPILVFCNKSDIDSSLGEIEIQSTLENELDDIRKTRSSAPSMLGNEEENNQREIFLGNEGESFQFDHLPNQITFIKGSIKSKSMEVPESIIEFINNNN